MTNDELQKQFDEEFERDCRSLSCETCDCIECQTYIECFEEYKQSLGYMPSIMVEL